MCRFLDAGEYNGSHALDRPASKKRQGTKSRSVVRRRCGARYGDYMSAGTVKPISASPVTADLIGQYHRAHQRVDD